MTDTDRDLLEMAARAAGLKEWGWMADTLTHVVNNQFVFWEPLTDDGDALRLAVKLGLLGSPEFFRYRSLERFGRQDADDITSTRRAIVRAAASLGDGAPKSFANDLPEDNYYKTQAEAEELGRKNSGDAK